MVYGSSVTTKGEKETKTLHPIVPPLWKTCAATFFAERRETPEKKMLDNFTYFEEVTLGSGEMHSFLDMEKNMWYFKPAQDKLTKNFAEFRAYIQQVAYQVQKIINPDKAVQVITGCLKVADKERFGAAQRVVAGTRKLEFSDIYEETAEHKKVFKHKLLCQVLAEHVTDWLIANFDNAPRNFIIDKDTQSKITGIDKEQAFRYVVEEINRNYQGELEDICTMFEPYCESTYTTIYDFLLRGQMFLPPEYNADWYYGNIISPVILKIENVSDDEYIQIFKEYIESVFPDDEEKQKKLRLKILERKHCLREKFLKLYNTLL